MRIEEDQSTGNNIQKVAPGKVWINDQIYTQPLLLTANDIHCPWQVDPTLTNIKETDLDWVTKQHPALFLLGTGSTFKIPPAIWQYHLNRQGIGFEAMDTTHAAFTFKALIAEGRQVVAGLLID